MRTETVKIYKFDELPEDGKQKALEYIRNNWHDLGQHCVDEMVESLKALAEAVNGHLNYSLSIVPDRGEFVKISDFNAEKLEELYNKKDECPLTGMCYDIDAIESLHNGTLEDIIKTLHAEGEYIYGDEGLTEMIEANGYEFYDNGRIA